MNRLRGEYKGRVDIESVRPNSTRGKKLAGSYGAVFTPTFVFVRADGAIQTVFLGEADEERLREELDQLLVH